MTVIDTLIHARWVIPIEPQGLVLENHSIGIHAGRIVALMPTAQAQASLLARDTVILQNHALLPGLVNAHTHLAMNLLRGLADDLPLMAWLQQHIWPAEAQWVSHEFVRDGSLLAMAELLRGGVTCFNDMYFFPEAVVAAAETVGLRGVVGMIILDFPSAWAKDSDAYFHQSLALHAQLQGHPLLRTALAPHAPYTVGDGSLARVAALAERLDLRVHIHVHETAGEVEQSLAQHGVRPLERLARFGLVSPRLLAVHMTQLSDAEISQIAQAGAHVLHCAESNLKLASGYCPVAKLRQAGVNVALGTDGAASNNDLDLFGELRTAALLAKAVAGDTTVIPASAALYMATLGGAKALGLAAEIGSLVVGKAADITAVNLGELETQPLYHPVSQLVYATSRQQVSDVWVAGRQLLRNRALTTLDSADLLARARHWQLQISSVNLARA
jgi:5-methylthioadenosine/S-adenosylhomocysteine deaminase